MPVERRLILFATDAAAQRLRDESGCRALRDGTVSFVSLDVLGAGITGSAPLNRGQAFDAKPRMDEPAFREAVAVASSTTSTPIAALWIARAPGDVSAFLTMLRCVGQTLKQEMQEDRNPLPIASCVIVAPQGLNGADEAAINCLLNAKTFDLNATEFDAELAAAVPMRVPVYLMGGNSRVDANGHAWNSAHVWPIAVARLLGSISIEPRRTPGLRAWRGLAVDSREASVDALDAEALALLNEVLAPEGRHDDFISSADILIHTEPHLPPADRVNEDHCPQHYVDYLETSPNQRPRLDDFCELTPSDFDPEPSDSPPPVHAGASQHTDDRLNAGLHSAWDALRDARGKVFVADRASRMREASYSFAGSRGIISEVWRHVHDSARNLRWYAAGGFFKTPGMTESQRLATQMLQWGKISSADAAAIAHSRCAKIEAAELDLARSHFISPMWRVTCALSAALFSTAAVSVPASMWGSGFVIAVALTAGVSSSLAMLVLLLMETRAGARGARSVDKANHRAEGRISDAFALRVRLGADGELLQRSTGWLQSAARIRDTAHRLLQLREKALGRMSPADESAHSAESKLALIDYRASTTVQGEFGAAPSVLSARLRANISDFVSAPREQFETAWRTMCRDIDPSEVGGISSAQFVPRIMSELEDIREHFRSTLVGETERAGATEWLRNSRKDIDRVFGPSTDLTGLSISTLRARGNDLVRVSHVFAPTQDAANSIATAISDSCFGSTCAVAYAARTDRWSGFALIVDEVTIRFPERTDAADVVTRFIEGAAPVPFAQKRTHA